MTIDLYHKIDQTSAVSFEAKHPVSLQTRLIQAEVTQNSQSSTIIVNFIQSSEQMVDKLTYYFVSDFLKVQKVDFVTIFQ